MSDGIGFPDHEPDLTPWYVEVPTDHPPAEPDTATFHGPFAELPTMAALDRPCPWGSYLDTTPLPRPPYSLVGHLRRQGVSA